MRSNKAFNFSEFCGIASRHEGDFADLGTVVTQGSYEGSTYTFKDNSSDVLGVAHLDTVQSDYYATMLKVKNEQVIMCPRLDDRLGVYIITRLLPKLGVTCDWLLTTGEECGQSSAELFQTDKEYNWAFSFDRAGTDAVLYQHDTKKMRRILRKAGFRVGNGSFSDLSSLDIGCSGINFGCGYQDCHSRQAYVILSDMFSMTDRFTAFWKRHAGEKLPYDPSSRSMLMSSDYWHRPYRYGRSSSRGYEHLDSGYSGYSGYSSFGRGYPDGIDEEKLRQNVWDATGLDLDDPEDAAEYLAWYENGRYNGSNGSSGSSGSDIVEDLADRAQSSDNGR